MKTYPIALMLSLAALCGSCSSNYEEIAASQDSYLSIPSITDTKWTYISFSKGEVIGTSVLGSSKEDEIWKQRTEWDLALCGKLLRTNSGTSGNGQGGILKIDGASYESIVAPSSADFNIDKKEKPY